MALLSLSVKVRFPDDGRNPVMRDRERRALEDRVREALPEGATLAELDHVWLTDPKGRK
jgi:hypothetical protein